MEWKRFFNAAFDTQEAASAAKKEVKTGSAKAAKSPGYLPNWIEEAGKLADAADCGLALPGHVTVELPGNWQVWLADDGSHREEADGAELSSILGAKADEAGLAYPLLIRPGSPCEGCAGYVAGSADGIAEALVGAYNASPGYSSCAVIMAVPAGSTGMLADGLGRVVVDFASGAAAPLSGSDGIPADSLARAAGAIEPPLGEGAWALTMMRSPDGGWLLLDMRPATDGERRSLPEPERPKVKGTYRFDELGRLVDPDGNVIVDDSDELSDGLEPTLDDDGELIAEDLADIQEDITDKDTETVTEPNTEITTVSEPEGVSSPAPAAGDVGAVPVEGAKPPAGVVESIPSWLLPMGASGETLMCTKHGDVYEFCVFDKNDDEGWAYSVDCVTMELKLLRDPSGNAIPAEEAVVRPAHKASLDDYAPAAEPSPDVPAIPADAAEEGAPTPLSDDEGTADAPTVSQQGQEPITASSPEPVPDVQDGLPPAPDPEPEAETEPAPEAVPVRDKPGRTAYLETRPELEHVDGRTFGEFLSDLMGAKGIKPAELAKKLGVSTSSVYHYCSNSKRPSFDSLKFLSEFFDCNIFRW